MIWTLQILVSVIFFTNKVFVLAEKKAGWLLGAIAASLAVFYFFFIQLYVYTALEFGLIALMGYGFLKGEEKKPQAETLIRVITIVVMLALGYFAWSGIITAVELVSSLALLVGTFLLTHNKARAGWVLYAVAHGLAAYLGYHKDQWVFADFQIASMIISVVGAMKSSAQKASS